TAHQGLSGHRGFDRFLGRLIGASMGVSYTSYIETHLRHHDFLNQPDDWELWPYAQPSYSLAFRRVFVWFDLILGGLSGPWIYGRIFFSPSSPIRSLKTRRIILLEYAF